MSLELVKIMLIFDKIFYVNMCIAYLMLTQCGLVTLYIDKSRVNIASCKDLLPGGTKPLPEPMLKYNRSAINH